jgi:hypothetical protein
VIFSGVALALHSSLVGGSFLAVKLVVFNSAVRVSFSTA